MNFLGMKRKIGFWAVNHLFAGTKYFEVKRNIIQWMGYKVGEGTKVVGPMVCTAELDIGKNCWIGKNFIVNGNGKVTIGDNCDIAPEVIFQTGGHKIGSSERRAGEGCKFYQSVGNGTWIGGRVTILNNAKIGDSCVIAGCACVIGDVADHSLVGGIPARLIRKLDDEDCGRIAKK